MSSHCAVIPRALITNTQCFLQGGGWSVLMCDGGDGKAHWDLSPGQHVPYFPSPLTISLPLSLLPPLSLLFSPSPFFLFLSLSWNRNKRMHTFLSLNPTIFSGVCVCDKSGKWICLHSSLLLFISVSTSVFPSLVSVCVCICICITTLLLLHFFYLISIHVLTS